MTSESMEPRTSKASPTKVAIASILIPGLGYWLIGQRARAMLTGGGIIGLFLMGILFAGVRVISLPGYEEGYPKYIEFRRSGDGVIPSTSTRPIIDVRDQGLDLGNRRTYAVTRKVPGGVIEEITHERPLGQKWVLLHAPFSAIGDNLWFLGQMLTGPLCAITGYLSIQAAQSGVERSYARLWDVGALYTAVAGMLNLLVIIDSAGRAAAKERHR